jgi:tryptophan synthase alpha chain
MNRIEQAFSGGKAFIPFITAGDPSIEITEQLVMEMAKEGADIIEVGIPFSDPSAEGATIQAADYRALAAGTTTDRIFDMIKRVRKSCDVPLALMTYINPIFSYGTEDFMKKCKEASVDAVIVPDVPFEERDELKPYCERYGITYISMIAPTSKERIDRIAQDAEGFIYCVSSLGVTGVRNHLKLDAYDMIKRVKEIKEIPCAIGFGISTPEQAKAMAEISDGVIVGSAIVKIIEEYGKDCVVPVIKYVNTMISAIKK